MSGDVTAAIERPTVRWVEPQPDSGPNKPAMPGHWAIEFRGSITHRAVPLAEVERLRAEREPYACDSGCNLLQGPDPRCAQHGNPAAVERIVQDHLRAEREALHSDETRARVGRALFGVAYDEVRDEDGNVLAHYRSIGVVQASRVDAVLSVLTADPEADRG